LWGGGGGEGDPNFFLDISSSWVEISLHTEFQLPSMPGSGSSMVGDKKNKKQQQLSRKLEASLAPAEADVGAVAKADQYSVQTNWKGLKGRLVDRQTNNLTY
jgi:hypothetical protein